MDLFRIIFKRILYNIPLKLLLLITIALILLLLFNSNVFAAEDYSTAWATATYNDTTFTYYLPQNVIECFKTLNEYTSGNYDFIWWYDGARYNAYFWDNSNNVRLYNSINDSINRYNYFFHSGNESNFECRYYSIYLNITPPVQDSYTTKRINDLSYNCYKDNDNKVAYFYTNKDIYINQNIDTIFLNGVQENVFIDPYISDTSRIDDMSFNYLMIEGGSEDFYINPGVPTRQRIFDLELDYQGYAYTMNINDYSIVGSDGFVGFAIPKYALFPQLIFRNGETLSFSLVVTPSVSPNSTGDWSLYSLGTFTLTLTTEQEEQLEQDRQAQQVENINNSINNVDNSINNVNQSIEETNEKVEHLLDTNVDSSSVNGLFNISQDLNAPDGSHIDDFFLILYNAFCYNEVVNLTFTLPFVNKQVVISSANVSSFYPQALKDIVSTIAWGGIALFIAKDIRSMINKINEGRPEYIGHDIKKEVL